MALKLGTVDAGFGGADKAFLGANQVWAAASGPAYDPRVTHAWNPIDGANAAGQVANLIAGQPPLYAVGDGAVSDWDGNFTTGVCCVLPSPDMGWYWGGAEFTITAWINVDPSMSTYGQLWGVADGDVFNGSGGATRGSWSVARSGSSNGFRTFCQTSYNAGANASGYTIPTNTWLLLATRIGAGKWRTIVNDYDSNSSLSWLNEDIPDTDIGVGFAIGYGRNIVDQNDNGQSGSNFVGQMKDVRIWNESISDADITALHAAGPLF